MNVVAGVQQLRLVFPGEQTLQFKDLSISIHEGERVLMLGPSGSGKSTLLQVLTGIIPHSIDIPLKYDDIVIPESWGYVFQDPETQFCMPYVDEELAFVLENLQIPRAKMEKVMREYLRDVGLHFDDLHIDISTLSQGMKQRLAIASVLALQPDVLILDEPTALLDPEGSKQVWETIRRVADQKTLIIVEHKIEEVIDLVNRVIVFNRQGQVIADGEPERIFRQCKPELMDYGIWYPGVWDDYIANRDVDRTSSKTEASPIDQKRISLHEFQGYYGKDVKISIPHLDIFAGEWIGIIGDNGAGKSTFLLALMQLIHTTGSYLLNGMPVQQIPSLPQHIAFVFQNPELQFVTNQVEDEIAYSLHLDRLDPKHIQTVTEQLLNSFDLMEKRHHHPYHLSMGQKRRLSVASAVVRQPQLLLLDEPTFGQDARNTFAILEKCEEWRKQGTTICMVTHDMNIIKHFATRVLWIEQGTIKLDTKPDVFLSPQGSWIGV